VKERGGEARKRMRKIGEANQKAKKHNLMVLIVERKWCFGY
jgi:hypothetical protein